MNATRLKTQRSTSAISRSKDLISSISSSDNHDVSSTSSPTVGMAIVSKSSSTPPQPPAAPLISRNGRMIVSEAKSTRSDLLYSAYQEWAMKTYGDSAKTKTVTRKKYARIVSILTGQETSSVENSKFRFWVKAKGFKLGPLPFDQQTNDGDYGNDDDDHQHQGQVLFVPCPKSPATVSSRFSLCFDLHSIAVYLACHCWRS